MKSTNPATEEVIETREEHDEATVDVRLDVAWDRLKSWRETPISRCEKLFVAAADVLREHSEEYAALVIEEMGKLVEQAISEVEKCAWACGHYAEHASEFLQDEYISTVPGSKTYVSYESIGPVLAVMPWNFPFWQVFRFAAPHIAAGNVAVLKYAPNAFDYADAIVSASKWTGYPNDIFTSLRIPAERVVGVAEDDRIQGVSLTGSTRAGWAVAETSGRGFKPAVLELGGNDPFVVFDDVPPEATAKRAARTRTQNSDQSCIAAKCFLVHEAIYDEFVERFTEEMRVPIVDDSIDPETDVGPQARADLMETLREQVMASVKAGATFRLGGEPLDRPGHHYPPTVLIDVPEDAPVGTEEPFGPVATVIGVEDEAEAVRVANGALYGLGAGVQTTDSERGEALTTKLTAGNVAVNHVVASDLRVLPSGTKDSGYETELSRHGIREFVNIKTVQVENAPVDE